MAFVAITLQDVEASQDKRLTAISFQILKKYKWRYPRMPQVRSKALPSQKQKRIWGLKNITTEKNTQMHKQRIAATEEPEAQTEQTYEKN